MKVGRMLKDETIEILKAIGVKELTEDNYYQVLNYILVQINKIQDRGVLFKDLGAMDQNMVNTLEFAIADISGNGEELDFDSINKKLKA